MTYPTLRIAIIGAGNVATHLSYALKKAGNRIVCVYSRTGKSAKLLAETLQTDYCTEVELITKNVDLYIISVLDNAIETVLDKFVNCKTLICHTSGTTGIDIFKNRIENYGVFYPLQTFSKTRNIDFSTVPLCIEANNRQNEKLLVNLARSISSDARLLNSEQRRIVHIAAVFACNFVNHFYVLSEKILRTRDISFDIIKPLIQETARKILQNNPIDMQTGPATRNDTKTIAAHLELLNSWPEIKKIYSFVSQNIYKQTVDE